MPFIEHQKVQDLLSLTMLVYDYSKKFTLDENETIETFVEDKSNSVRTNIIEQKNTLQSKGAKAKTRWVLHLKDIKNVKEKDAFPASKPRYSYWSKAK